MAKIRLHLRNAPVTEALIDFQVRSSPDGQLAAVQSFSEANRDQYKLVGPIFEFSTNVSISKEEGPKSKVSANELGIRLTSEDLKYVLQVRTNGFSVSRLEPYESWEKLMAEALRLWNIYQKHVKPELVIRVASRFINHLKLPMKAGEHFQEYLSRPPDVPDDLPQGVLGFMQRVVITEPELDLRANVIQLLQEGSAPIDHVPVILDIDVYKRVELQPDSGEIWDTLIKIRKFKNAIFFASLTEQTVDLYE